MAVSGPPFGATKPSDVPGNGPIPPLKDGDRLTRDEFERRYMAMPDLKKAELIEGVVSALALWARVLSRSRSRDELTSPDCVFTGQLGTWSALVYVVGIARVVVNPVQNGLQVEPCVCVR
jgi:hypothetical protein